MLETTWERAGTVDFPILWYLCYDTTLAVLETRRKPKTAERRTDATLFDDIAEAANADDVVATDRRLYYRMRLPYSEGALLRREVRGDALPARWRAQVFEITDTEFKKAG